MHYITRQPPKKWKLWSTADLELLQENMVTLSFTYYLAALLCLHSFQPPGDPVDELFYWATRLTAFLLLSDLAVKSSRKAVRGRAYHWREIFLNQGNPDPYVTYLVDSRLPYLTYGRNRQEVRLPDGMFEDTPFDVALTAKREFLGVHAIKAYQINDRAEVSREMGIPEFKEKATRHVRETCH